MLSWTSTNLPRWIALAIFVLFSLTIASAAKCSPRVVHVFVALADNQHQGIVPVPPALGNGSDPQHNLYWGAAYGVKTFFKASDEWQLSSCGRGTTLSWIFRFHRLPEPEGPNLAVPSFSPARAELSSVLTSGKPALTHCSGQPA